MLISMTRVDILWFMDSPFHADKILDITEERGVESKAMFVLTSN